jgi:hypothetical protein
VARRHYQSNPKPGRNANADADEPTYGYEKYLQEPERDRLQDSFDAFKKPVSRPAQRERDPFYARPVAYVLAVLVPIAGAISEAEFAASDSYRGRHDNRPWWRKFECALHHRTENPAAMRDFGPQNGETRTRTGDTTIFSRVLYQLSYLAATAS